MHPIQSDKMKLITITQLKEYVLVSTLTRGVVFKVTTMVTAHDDRA